MDRQRSTPVSRRGIRDLTPALSRWLTFELEWAAHELVTRARRSLVEHALTLGDLAALCVLDRQPGISQAALAERIGVDRTTMSQLADTLEGDGLVARAADPADGRKRGLSLTAEGQHALDAATVAVERMEAGMLRAFHSHEVEALRRGLRRLLA